MQLVSFALRIRVLAIAKNLPICVLRIVVLAIAKNLRVLSLVLRNAIAIGEMRDTFRGPRVKKHQQRRTRTHAAQGHEHAYATPAKAYTHALLYNHA